MTTTNADHRVQEALDAAGRKRVWLAQRTGVSMRTLHRYMNGAELPRQWKTRAAEALGLPASYLFPDDGGTTPAPAHSTGNQTDDRAVSVGNRGGAAA